MKRPNTQSGFTVVEMIVAIFAFSLILSIIGSVFVYAVVSQRRALNAQKVEENLSLVMEAMTREIRVAQPSPASGIFDTMTANNCATGAGSTTLHFINSTGQDIVYDLSAGNVRRFVNGQVGIMSSNTIEFTRLEFCIGGIFNPSIPGSYGKQPRITIKASARSRGSVQQVVEDYQTTVSLRFLGI